MSTRKCLFMSKFSREVKLFVSEELLAVIRRQE